jgi:hypothetical protein
MILPQVLGIIIYRRLRSRDLYLARLAGILLPPTVFFFVSLTVHILEMQGADLQDCGLPAAMGLVGIILMSFVQFGFSILIQADLYIRYKAQEKSRLQPSEEV